MTTQRRLKYESGKLAIYDVDSASPNDAPLTSPLSYVSRLHFHSDLAYPKVIATYSGTVSMPSLSTSVFYTASYLIAAHGRPGVPYVEGRINIGGTWVPLAGSVPVAQMSGFNERTSFARFLHLGADSSYIKLSELSVSHFQQGWGGYAFSYEIFVTDRLVA